MEHEMTETTVPDPTGQITLDGAADKREKRHAVYRGMIQHENDLRNQRLGWLFALNGFLFAAAGVVWTTSKPEPLLTVIAITGAVTSLSCWYSLWVGTRGIRSLSGRAESDDQSGDLPVVALHTRDLMPWLDRLKNASSPENNNDGNAAADGGKQDNEASKGWKYRVANWAVHAAYPWNMVPVALAAAWVVIPIVVPSHS
jgi:hypothetical protein